MVFQSSAAPPLKDPKCLGSLLTKVVIFRRHLGFLMPPKCRFAIPTSKLESFVGSKQSYKRPEPSSNSLKSFHSDFSLKYEQIEVVKTSQADFFSPRTPVNSCPSAWRPRLGPWASRQRDGGAELQCLLGPHTGLVVGKLSWKNGLENRTIPRPINIQGCSLLLWRQEISQQWGDVDPKVFFKAVSGSPGSSYGLGPQPKRLDDVSTSLAVDR